MRQQRRADEICGRVDDDDAGQSLCLLRRRAGDEELRNKAQDLSKTPDAPQAADAVEQKFPSAEEQEKDPGSILQYYKNAIELRRSNPEIARGSISVPDGELPEDTGVLLTEWEGKVSVILCNNATESVEIDLQQALPEGYNYTLKGSLNVGDQQEKLENNKLELPAYGIVILKQSGVD